MGIVKEFARDLAKDVSEHPWRYAEAIEIPTLLLYSQKLLSIQALSDVTLIVGAGVTGVYAANYLAKPMYHKTKEKLSSI